MCLIKHFSAFCDCPLWYLGCFSCFFSLSLSHFGHLRMQSHFPLFLHLFQVSFILKVHRVWICLRYLCVGVASLARGKDTDFQSFIFSSFWEPCLLFFSECNSLSTSVKPAVTPCTRAHSPSYINHEYGPKLSNFKVHLFFTVNPHVVWGWTHTSWRAHSVKFFPLPHLKGKADMNGQLYFFWNCCSHFENIPNSYWFFQDKIKGIKSTLVSSWSVTMLWKVFVEGWVRKVGRW